MPGHSPSKTGVNALTCRASTSSAFARKTWMAGTSPAMTWRGSLPDTCLRTRVEHRHCAAILRPAGNVIAHGDRPFLAVRDRAHAVRRHAARDEIVVDRLGAARAERQIVLAG